MAGIGFELKKLVEKRTLSGFFTAATSGVLVVAGPWIVSIISVSAAQALPGLAGTQAGSAFTAAMVYCFGLSLILTGAPLIVFVRVSADLAYKGRDGEATGFLIEFILWTIIPSLGAGLFLGLAFVPASFPEAWAFRIVIALLVAVVDALWAVMMTITVFRRPMAILWAYAGGMAVAYAGAVAFSRELGAVGALASLCAGYFAVLASLLVYAIREKPPKRLAGAFKEYIAYGKRYAWLALAGGAYSLGTWIDKIAIWFIRGEPTGGTGFMALPSFDTAFFFANLTIIPGLVYFTIVTETSYFLALKRFLGFLQRRRYPDIEAARVRLRRESSTALRDQSLFQLALAVAVLMLGPSLSTSLGFDIVSWRILVPSFFFLLVYVTSLNFIYYIELYRVAALINVSFAAINGALAVAGALRGDIPPGLSFLIACAFASVFSTAVFFSRIKLVDRIIFLRAGGTRYGN